ncbi:MAG: DUF4359 domain-containing protein [Phormidesmis sp.]
MKIVPTLALLSLAALGGTLAFTNPSEADYADYVSQTMSNEAQAYLCEPKGEIPSLSQRIDEAVSGLCQSTIGKVLGNDSIEEIVAENTERKNYLFFSTYETKAPLETYKTVGIFDRFYPYAKEDAQP